MRMQRPYTLLATWAVLIGLSCTPPPRHVSAQEPAQRPAQNPEASAEASATAEVLTRGPIHEAFATPVSLDPKPSPVIKEEPPQPINEVPPEIKPKDDDAQWIPGYWAWDDEEEDFLWVSGMWRIPPPGHRWMPGYWTEAEAEAGYHWIPGTWVKADVRQVSYQPYPPESQERGPTSPRPSDDHFWVPGCWEYHEDDYRWRPGYWSPHQYGWAWVPAHYRPAARGVVFVNGYWDYPSYRRGQLFAPVRFQGRAYTAAGFRYRPYAAIDSRTQLMIHLWARPAQHHYYFGDYYADHYRQRGFQPWYQYHAAQRGYAPMLAYNQWHYGQQGINFIDRITNWNRYFVERPQLRPPHTLASTQRFIAEHGDYDRLTQSVLGHSVDRLLDGDGANRFVRAGENRLRTAGRLTDQFRDLTRQRLDVERTVEGARDLPRRALNLPNLPDGVRTPDVRRNVPQRAFDLRDSAPVRRPDVRRPDVRRPDVRQPDGRRPDVRRPDVRRPDRRLPGVRQPNLPGVGDALPGVP